MSDVTATSGHSRYGLTDEDLAAKPTVYRDGLLEGHVVLITGGGGGFGRGMATLYARLGAKVVIASRNEDKLLAARDSIASCTGREIEARTLNIRDPDSVSAALDWAFERHGRLDSLINNAGGQFPAEAIDLSPNGWHAVIDTNLNGTWWMMQGAAQRWRDRGQPGNIINIVMPINRGLPQVVHSAAARAGVIFAAKSVSTAWAPLQIRVNCIAPGPIESLGLRNYPEELVRRIHLGNPMKAMGDVWDVAQACVYLEAPTGKFITGEVLTIDGGMQQWGGSWPLGVPDYFNVAGA